jgi:hypothetical protein
MNKSKIYKEKRFLISKGKLLDINGSLPKKVNNNKNNF